MIWGLGLTLNLRSAGSCHQRAAPLRAQRGPRKESAGAVGVWRAIFAGLSASQGAGMIPTRFPWLAFMRRIGE
jgi:hypothetical protein